MLLSQEVSPHTSLSFFTAKRWYMAKAALYSQSCSSSQWEHRLLAQVHPIVQKERKNEDGNDVHSDSVEHRRPRSSFTISPVFFVYDLDLPEQRFHFDVTNFHLDHLFFFTTEQFDSTDVGIVRQQRAFLLCSKYEEPNRCFASTSSILDAQVLPTTPGNWVVDLKMGSRVSFSNKVFFS